MKSYVKYVEEGEAAGGLAALYQEAKRRAGLVPANLKVASLRPEFSIAKENLRRTLLGDAASVGARRADLISVAVSGMNHCEYCGTAHSSFLVGRNEYTTEQASQLFHDWRKLELSKEDRVMLEFVEKLNWTPSQIAAGDIQALRVVGFSDENIVDIVALCAYRNFVNRLHDGLGLSVDNLRERYGDDFVNAFASEPAT